METSPSRRLLVLTLVAVGAFVWGAVTVHYRIFPYGLLPIDGDEAPAERGVEIDSPAAARGAGDKPAERRAGLWHKARDRSAAGAEPDSEAVEALADLPYLSGYEAAPSDDRVTAYEPGRAHQGWNLVVSGHAPEAFLMSMEGEVAHRWRRELSEVWPAMARDQDLRGFETFWRRAYAFPNGDLLAIYDGLGMVKLDRDSEILWAHDGREHHDLFLDEQGRIHTLTRRERREHDRLKLDGPIEEDFITVLDSDGRVEREFSVLESFLDSDYASTVALARRKGDILHTNTIELMDGRFADRHPLYARGNVLVSVPRLNTIAVIDPRSETVVWALSGMWRFQHQPTVLDNGNILLFDNTGQDGDSKVVEIEPLSQRIEWAYRGSEERRFTSYFLGSSQRLPNGNTLITESTAGRAFEVDRDGRIVWEFVNPHRAGENNDLIASLLEVVRLEPDHFSGEFADQLTVTREAAEDAP